MSLSIHSHRDGPADECPSCGCKQDGLAWLSCSVEQRDANKPGRIIVVSRCPRCGERSWAHFDEPTYRALVEGGHVNPPDVVLAELEVEA